ncbi:hypothetical protein QFC21_000574 [Naganishia friedmannii]|uniref:Uncharacterized protein n=1 Tax=Naganishia friedmannii TaxID=89922 RepID=A0ACC2WDP0_9TREE|nr:hypothetical protein QFC21_000574 [Naganishia friedmannii]
MPYLPSSPGSGSKAQDSATIGMKAAFKTAAESARTATLQVPEGLPVTHDVAVSVQPPTPDKQIEADPFVDSVNAIAALTNHGPSFEVEFPTSSPSASFASTAIPAIVQMQQTLPEVRSPTRRFKHFGSSTLWKDGEAGGPENASILDRMDSAPASQSRGRGRPRLFGFTEMAPELASNASSAESSRNGSRNTSPTRSPALEMIPRSNRRASAMRMHDRVSPPQSASTTPATSPTPVSAPLPSIPRRQSVVRTQSEANVQRPARAVPQRILARVAPKPSLSTRTSAQRNETALKLDLVGLASKHTDASSISPALPSPLIRKKSGEVLKPSLKSVSSYSDVGQALNISPGVRSLPSTPGCPKFVHFDTHLERVKLFLHDQKPEIVSREGSPIDCISTSEGEEYPFPTTDEEDGGKKQLEIRLPNFPTQHEVDADLYMESLFLDDDRKSLKGVIRVKNMAFSKWVAVRFTFDWWSTTNETSATFKESIQGGKYDRFQFTLRLHDMLHKIEDKALFIALRYNTDGREIWDNNGGQNYEVKFVKKATVPQRSLTPVRPHGSALISPGMGRSVGGRSSQWDVNGKRDDRMSDLRAHLSRLASGDDRTDDDDHHQPIVFRGQSTSPVRRPGGLPRRKESNNGSGELKPPSSPGYGPSSPLAQRYDFSYSLQGARGGKKTSPSTRPVDLPSSPTGLNFPTDNTRPSMDFYSPQLNHLKISPEKAQPKGAIAFPPTSLDTDSQQTATLPQLALHEPSPPLDYFAASAPSGTVGPDRKSPVPPTTELPRMYSTLPSFMAVQQSNGQGAQSSLGLGLTTNDRDTSNDQLSSLDDSPPSISNSTASSITSSDSPQSPSQPELPRAASIEDLARLDYNSILEKFCWGGNAPGRFAHLGAGQLGAQGSRLDRQHSSSESDIPKYYINHLETHPGDKASPSPSDKSTTPKTRFRNGNNQEKEKGDTFFKAVSRSFQSSPAQSPLPTPNGRTAVSS